MRKIVSPWLIPDVRLWLLVLLTTAVFSACQHPSQTAVLPAAATNVPTVVSSPTPAPRESAATFPVSPLPPTATSAAYPVIVDSYPAVTQAATSYPALPTATAVPAETAVLPTAAATHQTFLPLAEAAADTPTLIPTLPPTPTATPTPIPTVDFTAVRASLQAQGQTLATNKIGFHVTLMEQAGQLDQWMQTLDRAGVPVFLKSVDNAEPLYKAQELMKQSGVPHVLVFRATGGVPNYDLPPVQAAQLHWQEHRALWPPELDPSLVWMETINEVDKNRADWLAQFALETAQLALNDGFKWAAFGWAAGEPEPEQWQLPAMLDFLRLAGANPERLAVALHEYSYDKDEVGDLYPYKIGRFQELFRIADVHAIPRPTVLITEWGWEYKAIPKPDKALRDIAWAARLYAAYPQVKGAAMWHLGVGCCFADISQQTEQLIEPLTVYSVTNYFAFGGGETAVSPDQYRP